MEPNGQEQAPPAAKAHYEFWPSPTAWITPTILLVAFMVALGFAPDSGSKAFYESSAQVIPVIMLTLAIEARAFEWRLEWQGWRDRWNRGLDGHVLVAISGVTVLLALVIAQVHTLVMLTGDSFEHPEPKFVFAAMATGFAAVVLVAVPRSGSAGPR